MAGRLDEDEGFGRMVPSKGSSAGTVSGWGGRCFRTAPPPAGRERDERSGVSVLLQAQPENAPAATAGPVSGGVLRCGAGAAS